MAITVTPIGRLICSAKLYNGLFDKNLNKRNLENLELFLLELFLLISYYLTIGVGYILLLSPHAESTNLAI